MLHFRTLWQNHPSTKGENFPCKAANGKPNFRNQCAIRMGLALSESGMNMQRYRGARCWYRGHKNHALRVEELAKWLKEQKHEVGTVKRYAPGAKAKDKSDGLMGKSGIVACINFWGAGNQGDHIDLWDGVSMRRGSSGYFDKSKEVLFWEIK